MKSVLVLRHAKSSWSDPDLDDHDRPLNRRGERDAPRMGRLIKRKGLAPELILSSTAVRARTTARIVADTGCEAAELRLTDELYLTDPEEHVSLLAELPDRYERVMVVGHNPSLEGLVTRLTGDRVTLPTAALVRLRMPIDRWSELTGAPRGELLRVWHPKELEKKGK